MTKALKWFILVLSMFFLGFFIGYTIKEPEIIFYKADSSGSERVGVVVDKEVIDDIYFVEIRAYGRYMVSEEQYNKAVIGETANFIIKEKTGGGSSGG